MTKNRESVTEVIVVVGTRPEIIKMAPVIRCLESSSDLSMYLVHTGQHYDQNLSGAFFEALNIPMPDKNLEVGSGKHYKQTADGIHELGGLFSDRSPEIVLAQGDTNAVLASALATSKSLALFGHVEAGIRSFDRSMPEEVNRLVADNLADVAFAPTEQAVTNLSDEGITKDVYLTGNTVVDACLEHSPLAEDQSDILNRLDLDDEYVVATIHRERNVTDLDRLRSILNGFGRVEPPVILPAHPRTADAISDIDHELPENARVIDPLGYLDFLKLMNHATTVVTDSGGIQEETSILQVPCLTVRPNTERPETVEVGVNELVEPTQVGEKLRTLLSSPDKRKAMQGHPHLYGNGAAGEQIVEIVQNYVSNKVHMSAKTTHT